ncbi:MAG: hypothetical protein ACOX54_09910 [Christensenellales bacterium]|jgi:hypothetical protein|nr:hypothetical protein [Christensenellaceae bacterium]
MRLRFKHKLFVRSYKVGYVKSKTGAITESLQTGSYFYASLHPIDQRRWRDYATLRPIERHMIIPEGFPDVIQGDKLQMQGDRRMFRVTEARKYPSHMEIEVEVQP